MLTKKLGSCIEKARPYYDLLEIAKKQQKECQEAALQYQKASGNLHNLTSVKSSKWYKFRNSCGGKRNGRLSRAKIPDQSA